MRQRTLLRAIRQDADYQKSALKLARDEARLRTTSRKFRTKCLIELGADALKAELDDIHDQELETSIRDKRAKLYILESEMRAAGVVKGERHRKPDTPKSPPQPRPHTAGQSPIPEPEISIVRFKSMPPEGIRKRLKDLKFFYDSETVEWSGLADIATVKVAIHAEGVGHLVKYLRKSRRKPTAARRSNAPSLS